MFIKNNNNYRDIMLTNAAIIKPNMNVIIFLYSVKEFVELNSNPSAEEASVTTTTVFAGTVSSTTVVCPSFKVLVTFVVDSGITLIEVVNFGFPFAAVLIAVIVGSGVFGGSALGGS